MQIVKKLRLITLLMLLFATSLTAQENVLYYMFNVPQTLLLNPANKYTCRAFIELPVLSKIYLGIHNTGFGYNTVFTVDPETGSTIIDLDKMYSKMPKTNFLRMEFNINILGFGFQVKKLYFTFNVYNHTDFKFGLPRDIIGLKNGNYQDGKVIEEIDLSNLGVDVLNYTAISVSASRNFYENWRFGVRAKYILGHANLNTRKSVTKWLTDENLDSLNFETDILLNSSPLLANTGDEGLKSIGINENISISDLLKNRGFALDLGGIYNYTDKITLNASITDLGLIIWKASVTQFKAKGAFTWSGLELSDTTDFNEIFTDLGDSLLNAYTFSPTDKSKYALFLPTKLYIGGTYQLHEKVLLGVVNKTMILKKKPHTSLTFSANLKPLKFLTTTITYSMMDNTYNNLGFGLAIGKKGAQFYIATDKVPINFARIDGIPVPYSARTFDLQFGLNIIFACKKKIKEFEALSCPQHRVWDKDIFQRYKRSELRELIEKQKSKRIFFYKEKETKYKKKKKR